MILKHKTKSAYTLLEAVIVTGIILMVMSTVLVSYPRFIEMVNLRKGVQILASDIRRIQVYGISVRENPVGSNIFPGYGIHFDFNDAELAKTSYILFADTTISSPPRYDPPSEKISKKDVPSPGYLFQLCYNQKTTVPPSPMGDCNLTSVDIIFKRPVPDVYLYSATGPVGPYRDVELVVQSPRGSTKRVVIWRTGQIAVE